MHSSDIADALPWFRYHPDPVASGSVVPSEKVCRLCGKSRGFIYVGPAYAVEEFDECICPWCIANGSARKHLDVCFVDPEMVGRGWQEVPRAVVEEVAYRTPGFVGWQQERWFTHCGDAAAFIAPMGRLELGAIGIEAVAAIREESGYEGQDWEDYFQALDKTHGPTAYLFRCLHCSGYGGYSDCH